MAPPGSKEDLRTLARRLCTTGPVKTHPTPRRVRILHKGVYIADTTNALYVWEHEYYPYFYISIHDLDKSLEWVQTGQINCEDDQSAVMYRIFVRETEKVDDILLLKGNRFGLRGLVRVPFGGVDTWLEEDLPITVHPKDPFKRVDLLPSTRPIRITIPNPSSSGDDITLASTPYSVHLHETLLPTRYYMPLSAIDVSLLQPSAKGTKTLCPYKGEAEYYDIHLPTSPPHDPTHILPDIIWYYTHPTPECSNIAGLCCFYNEKIDVWIDGVRLDRCVTHFA